MAKRIWICLLLVIPAASVSAQSREDTTFLVRATENAIKLYQEALGAQSKLYNGSKYFPPKHTLDEHPFFSSEDWILGAVFYDGEYFQDVPLMYDLHGDVLITEHLPSGHAIQLVEAKLKSFSMAGHVFERIDNESVGGTLPRSGFYDILYPGETRVIAKRRKTVHEQIVSTVIERSFEARNRYFIFKNGVFFPVKSKASALKLMRDKKRELKRFLKETGASLSQNRELLLKSLAERYDSLK